MTDAAVADHRRDPLAETLFRPTVVPEVVPGTATAAPTTPRRPASSDGSAAPHRAAGTRVRAGNAMARTRAALLDGAARSVVTNGTSITMAQVALTAGVAKATLYNHFRTREAVLGALALAEVEALADDIAGLPVRQALVEAAAVVATHPALATLRDREPGLLAAALADPEPCAALVVAREALLGLLVEADLAVGAQDVAADLLLRWLVSLALAPAAPTDVLTTVDVLLAGLLA